MKNFFKLKQQQVTIDFCCFCKTIISNFGTTKMIYVI